MLSWPALQVSSPYLVGLIIRKARNYLVTAANCHYTCQPMSQHIIGLLPMLQQPTHTCSNMFQKSWPLPKPFSSASQPTQHAHMQHFKSLSSVHSHKSLHFASTNQPNALHNISSSQQPSTVLHSSYQAHTQSNHQPSHQCHAPSHRVSTICYCPISKSVSAHHGPPLPWPWGIMWSKVPPHATPHHAHHSKSSRENELVLLKEQLGASLDRHEKPLVY